MRSSTRRPTKQELARRFVGQLYDLFVEHQGLLLTLMAAETLSEDELAETGIADIRRALTVLSQIGAEGMRIRGMRTSNPDLPAHSTVAMIAGHGRIAFDVFRVQAALERSHRRRTRPSDTARIPASTGLTRQWGAAVDFWWLAATSPPRF